MFNKAQAVDREYDCHSTRLSFVRCMRDIAGPAQSSASVEMLLQAGGTTYMPELLPAIVAKDDFYGVGGTREVVIIRLLMPDRVPLLHAGRHLHRQCAVVKVVALVQAAASLVMLETHPKTDSLILQQQSGMAQMKA